MESKQNDGYGQLGTEITRTQAEEWTISFMVYLYESPGTGFTQTLCASSPWDAGDNSEFILQLTDSGSDWTLFAYIGDDSSATTRTSTVDVPYLEWTHIGITGFGDGTFSIYVDGAFGGNHSFIGSSFFGLKYIGNDTTSNPLNGLITEFAYYNDAFDYIIGTNVNVKMERHADSGKTSTPLTLFRTPTWYDTIDITSDFASLTLTTYDSVVEPPYIIIESDYASLSLTTYDSEVGPRSETVYGPYTFDTQVGADASAFLWEGPSGTGLNPSGSTRRWSHDTNDTPSTNVGPTSGQGGSPDGYAYTEMSSGSLGDVFTMEFDTTLDAAANDVITIEFYTNQRGDDNDATCQVQINENGAGWVNKGSEFGGPSDPDKVASGGTQIWTYRKVEITDATNASTRIRLVVTAGLSGSSFHNDYGIDTVTITETQLR
jgi:hypothetical protein